MIFYFLLLCATRAQFFDEPEDNRTDEEKENEILRMIKNREKQLEVGRGRVMQILILWFLIDMKKSYYHYPIFFVIEFRNCFF